MTRNLKVAAFTLGVLLIFTPLVSAFPHGGYRGGFRGGFGGGFGYGPGWYGPGWGWGGWGGWYGPGWDWYGPGWYGPYGYAYVPSSPTGKVKIETKAKDTEVYVDGGYAGTVKQLGTFRLKPGAHNLELRHPDGETFYKQKITVLRGSTTDIRPEA